MPHERKRQSHRHHLLIGGHLMLPFKIKTQGSFPLLEPAWIAENHMVGFQIGGVVI
jgi:hypothetical protein